MKKRCSKCKLKKSYSKFGKNSKNKDGLQTWCKTCRSVNARESRAKRGCKKRYSYKESHRVSNGVPQKKCCTCHHWKDLSDFSNLKSSKDNLRPDCRVCAGKFQKSHRIEILSYQRKYSKEYRGTVNGHIRHIYYHIKQSCNNPNDNAYKYYGKKGIKLKFSVDELIDYVTNTLKIDPKELWLTRIDRSSDYTLDNIQFILPYSYRKEREDE